MAKDRNRLLMQKLDELSMVDNGANQHANVAIFKRAKGLTAARKNFAKFFKQFVDTIVPSGRVAKEAQSYVATRAIEQLWSKTSALSTSISSIFGDDNSAETRQQLLDATISQFRDDIQSLNVDDAAFAATEDAADVNKHTPAPVAEPHAGATGDDHTPEGDSIMKTLIFTDLAQANAHIAKLSTDFTTLEDTVATLEAAADPIAAVTKGMPPAAAKLVRDQAETIAKLTLNDRRGVLVAKAATIVGKTGADVDKVVTILEKLGDDKDSVEYFGTVLKNYDTMLAEIDGLELGTEGGPADGGDANAALDAAATEVMKLNPKLTRSQAVAKALEINPALYDETELAESVTG